MDFLNSFSGFSGNYAFQRTVKNGSSSSSSLVLDHEKGELVRSLVRPGQKGVNAEKALIALRNHSEAERRRRERINGHLTTLRSLIPGTSKVGIFSFFLLLCKYPLKTVSLCPQTSAFPAFLVHLDVSVEDMIIIVLLSLFIVQNDCWVHQDLSRRSFIIGTYFAISFYWYPYPWEGGMQ